MTSPATIHPATFRPSGRSRRAQGRQSPVLQARCARSWLARLEDRLDEAVRLAGEQRVRVWRIYQGAALSGFRTGFTSI
jgi:cyclopropane fatty-acyl-phospholipid synthase-like methyltransferase